MPCPGEGDTPGCHPAWHRCPRDFRSHPGFQTGKGAWHSDQDVEGEKPVLGHWSPLECLSRGGASTSFTCGHTLYSVLVFSVLFFI